jgi:hypothetical protein
MATKIQLRRDSSANWTSLNPTLSEGEVGFEINTGRFKIGNGSSLWSSLEYFETDLSAYLTASSASTIYLTQASASTTYLEQSSASTTYLTQASASTTYLTKNLNIIEAKTANYTLQFGDEGSFIQANGTFQITVPLDSEVNFPIGTQINLLNIGTGDIEIESKFSLFEYLTINATPGLKLRTQWSSATLIKRAPNTWVLVGDLTV